jgi:regulator of replication initiation timing
MEKEVIEERITEKNIDKMEINDLKEYVKKLEIKISELFKVIEAQNKQIGILTEENGLLKEEIKRLKSSQKLNSENSSKPPSTDRKGKKKQ